MKKALKIILIIAIILAFLLAVLIGLVIYKPKLVEGPLQKLLYEQTGLQFTTDKFSLELSPTILSIDGFSLINPEWSSDKPLLELKNVEVKLDLANMHKSENPFWSALINKAKLRIEKNDEGLNNWRTSVIEERESSNEPLALNKYLRFNNIEVRNSTIHQIQASGDHILTIKKLKLSNYENIIDLEGVGAFENEPINFTGSIDASNLGDGIQELILSMQGNGLGIDVESSGTINLSNFSNTDFKTYIKTDNLAKLEKSFATEFPLLAPIELSIALSSTENNRINFTAEGNIKNKPIEVKGNVTSTRDVADRIPVSVEITGLGSIVKLDGVVDFENFEKLNLSTTASINNLEPYEDLLNQYLPNISAINTSFNLSKDKSLFSLSEIEFAANDASLSGSVSYDTKKLRLIADLQSDNLDLTPYFENSSQTTVERRDDITEEIDQTDSFHASTLVNEKITTFSSDIKFSSNLLKVKEHEFKDLNLEVSLDNGLVKITNFVSKYNRVVDDNFKNGFTSAPISMAGYVKLPSEEDNNMDIDMTLDDQDMRLAVNGSLEITDALSGQLAVEGNAKELNILSAYMQQDLKALSPATLNLVANFNGKAVDLNPFKVEINENDLTGQTVIDWSNDKVSISGEIQSQRLNLNQFEFGTESDVDSNNEAKDSDKIFSKTNINWNWLDDYDVNLSLNITQLSVNKTNFRSITSRAKLAKGKLLVEPFDGILANGGVRGSLSIEKHLPGVKITSNVVGLNITPEDFGESDESVINGGNTDVEIDLTMTGVSAHDLAASLNGEFVLEMRKAKMRNDLLDSLGSDIFIETLSMLNPFVKEDEYTDLDCAAARFVAKDGVLISRNQIAIETSKVEIVAGGIINLDTEQLEIGFTPVAKKGLGVNIGNLVKFVRLGGTLREPVPEADPAGMLKSGAAIGAAISTGGLSLFVDGLFKRLTTAGTACNHIFEEDAEMAN